MLDAFFELAHREKKVRRERYPGGEYLRLVDDVKALPRGTLRFREPDAVAYGYPQIGRILRLETGLAGQFDGPFQVEEKIDGYNVRILRRGSRLMAFTRGGFLCPFTTDRLPDLVDLRILKDQPDLVICAEVAGPDQPYMVGHPPQVTDDVALFVFDFMRLDRADYVAYDEKEALLEAYGLPSVTRFGRYTTDRWREIRDLIWELNQAGREGLVFKSHPDGAARTKYVTANSCVEDIRSTVDNILDLPAEYFTNRILRLSLFMDEEGMEKTGDLRERLGHALVDGLFRALEMSKREHRIYHTHRCRFRHEAAAGAMLVHLKKAQGHLHVAPRSLQKQGDFYLLEFDKQYARMTDLMEYLRGGGMLFD